MNIDFNHPAHKWHSCLAYLKNGTVVSGTLTFIDNVSVVLDNIDAGNCSQFNAIHGNQAMFPLTSIEWLAPVKAPT